MGKKKRNHPDVEEILARPWCYYCERDFDDLKILINHQKAKHFKCERCGRRLNTAGGLSVHMSQVHKENLTAVDNALPNRAGLDIEIFGMEGIPEEIIQQHNQRVLTQFHQAEAERRAASGQGPAGGIGANPAKKPKTDISDLKKRLAEHKAAKLAAENGDGSRTTTPDGTSQTQSPAPSASFQAPAPNYQQYQQQPQPYAPPPSAASYGQAVSYSQPPTPTGYQAPGYPQAASPVYGQPPAGIPYQHPPYAQPPQPPFQQQPPLHPLPNALSPPPFQTPSPYPGQPFSPTLPQNGRSGQPVGIPHPFNSGSPAQNQQQQQQRTNSPGHNGLPVRPGSGALPAAPGLPQRPTFGAPPVNAFQFQQMHQGQIPAPQFSPPAYSGPPGVQNGGHSAQPPPGLKQDQPSTAAIDDLISSASKQADANTAVAASKPAETQPTETSTPTVPTTTEPTKSQSTEEKAAKKEKEKAKQTRLVYSDNEISPEEKMAAFPKYAFTSQQQTVTV